MRKADKEWEPFVLSTNERKDAHKWLLKQAKGIIPEPIQNLTLNRYFEIVQEAMLALCDNNGVYRSWYETSAQINYKKMTPLETAKICMDGRSLFHSDYGDPCGLLGDIDPNNPKKFKWWVCNAKWGGHPWETKFGNFDPYPIKKNEFKNMNIYLRQSPFDKEKIDRSQYYTDMWLLFFSTGHRCTPFALRCFIHLQNIGLPVIWIYGENEVKYLTKRYLVNSKNEPDWLTLDETFFKK